MAVTRRCRSIHVNNSWEQMKELQIKLNSELGQHERIVFMAQTENRASEWYVVTEELIMGPNDQ